MRQISPASIPDNAKHDAARVDCVEICMIRMIHLPIVMKSNHLTHERKHYWKSCTIRSTLRKKLSNSYNNRPNNFHKLVQGCRSHSISFLHADEEVSGEDPPQDDMMRSSLTKTSPRKINILARCGKHRKSNQEQHSVRHYTLSALSKHAARILQMKTCESVQW